MRFWLFTILLGSFVAGVPYIRCFYKRIVMAIKLKKICHRKGIKLYPNNFCWFLGSRNGTKCDFYIETQKSIFSVKLFGVPKRSLLLVFTAYGKYIFKRIFIIRMRTFYDDGHSYDMINYDFQHMFQRDWYIKSMKQIVLVNPVSHEIRYRTNGGDETVVGSGEIVNGMYIFSLSRFISYLMCECDE